MTADTLHTRVSGAANRAYRQGRGIAGTAREVELPFLAAAVAFYALLSLLPLLSLVLAAASVIDAGIVERAVDSARANGLTAGAGDAVVDAALAPAGRVQATVLGTAVLLWSGSRVFRGVDVAFARIYGGGSSPWSRRAVDAGVVMFCLSGSALGLVIVALLVNLVGGLPAGAGVVVLPIALTVAVLPPFRILPNVDIDVRAALPGAIITGISWTILGSVFGAYTAIAGDYAAYGALGVVILFMGWLYLAALCFLGGAVVNATLVPPAGDGTPVAPIGE